MISGVESGLTIPFKGNSHLKNIQSVQSAAEAMSAEDRISLPELHLSSKEISDFILFTAKCYQFNRQFRRAVRNNYNLPDIVRNDPPSLRSAIWLVMTDEALTDNPSQKNPKPLNDYPWALYALTRAYLNGFDDVMDRQTPPVTKRMLMENDGLASIEKALAQEFFKLSRTSNREGAIRSLSFYRSTRDLWIEKINEYEKGSDVNFDEAIKYDIEIMGPLTALILYTIGAKRNLSPEKELQVAKGLVWYAAAGKIMDDMTDWFKDWQRQQPNILTQAMRESGELDKVVELTYPLRKLGEKTFIPITILNSFAPKATERTLEAVDGCMNKLAECKLPRFTTSLTFVRHNMWAYALNEGVPQV